MKTVLVLIILIATSSLFSQSYSKCKVFATDKQINELSDLGIPVDHGIRKKNTFFISDFSAQEIKIMRDKSFKVEVMIADVTTFYQNRSLIKEDVKRGATCGGISTNEVSIPVNFQLGSMAGFYTYAEFLAEIDKMQQLYPNLITSKAAISTFLTHENRPIYWLKISDNPSVDESEPEVLYTSIHHAREPASLTNTIFYMWYLLENYATNPEIKYLIDETEMYFVPLINPDGYIENQNSQPNGGGMWRKNKRDNLDGTFGVDLNRNYSYDWGTTGISFNTNSDVYPGTGPFSEPETQAIKWFCENRDFRFAFNAHTYSNLMLFPIGSQINVFAADHDYLLAIGSHMAQYNGYIAQKASDLYAASGDSDDYMYMEDLNIKPKIFAYTPEIGSSSDGFWPAQSEIIPLCQGMIFPNLTLAHATHNYYIVKDLDPNTIISTAGNFNFSLNRIGIETNSITVSIEPLQGIQSVGGAQIFSLPLNSIQNQTTSYVLNSSIQLGDEIKYVLTTNFGSYIQRDTLTKVFGNPTLQVFDDAASSANWFGDWALTSNEFYSPSNSFTESVNGDYSNFDSKNYEYINSVNLTNATQAKVEFYAKWSIEKNFDFARFEVSTDGGSTWIGQCGKYSTLGNSSNGSVQPQDEPVYDGVQSSWVLEEINLNDYLGQIINLRFVFMADGGVTDDGFYFDDFKILYNLNNVGIEENEQILFNLFPNPAKSSLKIALEKGFRNAKLTIYDIKGKSILSRNFNESINLVEMDVNELNNGIYYLELEQNAQVSRKKFTVVK